MYIYEKSQYGVFIWSDALLYRLMKLA
jgi:hypothetical protein